MPNLLSPHPSMGARLKKMLGTFQVRCATALALCALLYVLSIGPAMYWVTSAVIGQPSAKSAAAIYDARLSIYYRIYAPLFRVRYWILFHVSRTPEEFFWRYESLFARPRTLADGREVFSTFGREVLPGQTTAEYLREILEDHWIPKPQTEVYNLSRSHRVLVVLAPDEDDLILTILHPPMEDSLTSYADLQIP